MSFISGFGVERECCRGKLLVGDGGYRVFEGITGASVKLIFIVGCCLTTATVISFRIHSCCRVSDAISCFLLILRTLVFF